MEKKKGLSLQTILTIAGLALVYLLAFLLDRIPGVPIMLTTVLRKGAIYSLVAVSMNLLNGFTGLFSLGQAGFMLVGAYAFAAINISSGIRSTVYQYYDPLLNFSLTETLQGALGNTAGTVLGVFISLLLAGLLAAVLAYLIGLPVLKLKSDYLAIATLGFSEIIRIVITNAQSLTNGAQGLKSIPATANIWWCYGVALATVVFIALLISSSYGRAFKAIREDEIAAESMGVSLLRHKMLSFMLSAFLAAVGGGLFASYIGTIGPDVFQVSRTYDILMIVVMGGMGSISGSVLAAFIGTIGQEWLRVLDGPLPFLPFWPESGVSGMRMVVFSILLLIVILFFRNGLFGHNEVTWSSIGNRLRALSGHRREVSGHE